MSSPPRVRRIWLLAIAVTCVSAPAAPAGASESSWPLPQHDPQRTAYNADETAMGPADVRRAVRLGALHFDDVVVSVLQEDGDLFVHWGQFGSEYGIDRIGLDGTLRWTSQVGNSTMAVGEGIVVSGSSSIHTGCGSSSILDAATGTWQWSHDGGVPLLDATTVFSWPQEYDSEFDSCFPSATLALDPVTGTERWSGPPGGIVAGDGVVYLGSGEGTIRAIDEATGAELWRLERGGRTLYPAALADGTLLVTSRRPDHRNHVALLAVDTATHLPRWRHAFEEYPQVVVGDGRVVVEARRLTALRLRTGATEWTSWHENVLDLHGADGVVYVEDYVVDDVFGVTNRWVALRARDGAELRVFPCNDLIVADGHVFTTKRNRVAIWGPPG